MRYTTDSTARPVVSSHRKIGSDDFWDWIATYWKPSLGTPAERRYHRETGRTHGAISTYQAGCRCELCKGIARESRKRYRRGSQRDAGGSDRTPTPAA